jgi:phospholipase A1
MMAARRALALSACALLATAAGAQSPTELQACAAIADDRERLACFDHLTRPERVTEGTKPAPAPAAQPMATPVTAASPLEERWSIGRRDGVAVRPHEPTYLLVGRATDRVNQRPSSPTRPAGPVDIGLEDVEAKFQLSFKFRVADFDPAWAPDMWVAYTQQSHWQVYTADLSRPFRETNYAPELMFAWHPGTQVGPLRWRLFNVGLMHQSNGRSQVLSRSWNRVYAQFGFDSDDWLLLVRPWARLSEAADEDDNPDITDFMTHGDVVLSYRWNSHVFSAKARHNFSTGRGYVEGTWSFPLLRGLNGYVQATSGYGESLVDYNWRQNTIGVGVSLFDWH